MTGHPVFSLIVPTRQRTQQLRRLLDSLAATAARLAEIEVVVVVDEDDPESISFHYDDVPLRKVVVAAGLSMGALNMAGYEAGSGRYLMLLNDDVIARTPGWDDTIAACFRDFPDDLALIHTNDLLFGETLCTFPVVSRAYCEFAGGICPRDYVRYRIDDHIGDTFNLLALLGERRIVYLPDVIFEHFHYDEPASGVREYTFDHRFMAVDAPRFEALRPQRAALALRLKDFIEERSRTALHAVRRQNLEAAAHAFDLREPRRLRVRSEGVDPDRALVTVGVVRITTEDDLFRRCIETLRQHAPRAELLILEPRDDEPLGRAYNRLIRMTESDYLVLMSDRYLVEATWLEALVSGLRYGAALATPLIWDELGRPTYAGIALEPVAAQGGPRELLTLPGDICLLDTARCRDLLFDERYSRYFAGLDISLRAWEGGLPIACVPSARVTRRPGSQLRGAGAAVRLERDRKLFTDVWLASGRAARLGGRLTGPARELERCAELSEALLRLQRRGWRESVAGYRTRAGRLLDEARQYPVLTEAFADMAAEMQGENEIDVDDLQLG